MFDFEYSEPWFATQLMFNKHQEAGFIPKKMTDLMPQTRKN